MLPHRGAAMTLLDDRRLLCQQLARLVFELSPDGLDSRAELPDWPGRLDLAWQVVRACERKGLVWEITNMRDGVRRWHARVRIPVRVEAGRDRLGAPALVEKPWARGDSFAEAVCRAAVAGLGE